MSALRMAAVAAPFGRDLEADFRRIDQIIADARAQGVRLLALPEACLGGHPAGIHGPAAGADGALREQGRHVAAGGPDMVAGGPAGRRSRTSAAQDLAQDRWTIRFNIFDQARALENQIVWLSANQSGTFGSLRFVASAKVVDPGGEILASTGVTAGPAGAGGRARRAPVGARPSIGPPPPPPPPPHPRAPA